MQGIIVFTGSETRQHFFACCDRKELFALPVSYHFLLRLSSRVYPGLNDQLLHAQINDTVRNEESIDLVILLKVFSMHAL